jgi:hypothetical protein
MTYWELVFLLVAIAAWVPVVLGCLAWFTFPKNPRGEPGAFNNRRPQDPSKSKTTSPSRATRVSRTSKTALVRAANSRRNPEPAARGSHASR